ncbi:unnamed protein product [Prunus armeniaca]
MNSNCLRLALDFALVDGTTNAKADTIHMNSGSPCLRLSPCGWKCSNVGLVPPRRPRGCCVPLHCHKSQNFEYQPQHPRCHQLAS